MFRWFYILPHLILEANAARRDARVRFLMAQVDIIRRKLGGNRVVPSPMIVPACWRSALN